MNTFKFQRVEEIVKRSFPVSDLRKGDILEFAGTKYVVKSNKGGGAVPRTLVLTQENKGPLFDLKVTTNQNFDVQIEREIEARVRGFDLQVGDFIEICLEPFQVIFVDDLEDVYRVRSLLNPETTKDVDLNDTHYRLRPVLWESSPEDEKERIVKEKPVGLLENKITVEHLTSTLIVLRNRGVATATVRPNEVSLLLNRMGSGYHDFSPSETAELADLLSQASRLAAILRPHRPSDE